MIQKPRQLFLCRWPTLLLAGVVAAHATTLHVSPNGDDHNPGTPAQPIRTLAHAQDVVRTLNQNMAEDVMVYLHGGTYRLDAPLVLEPRDSGTNGHNIVYVAAASEQPVIQRRCAGHRLAAD